MMRVSMLRRARELGVRFSLGELTLEEFNVLDLMDREEAKWREEMRERQRQR